jgi:transposase-like protein
MKRVCKSYNPELKAKIVLELLKGNKEVVEIASEYNLPRSTILEWKERLENQARDLFIPQHEKDKQVKKLKDTVSDLHKIIGEITIENNFLKKNYIL